MSSVPQLSIPPAHPPPHLFPNLMNISNTSSKSPFEDDFAEASIEAIALVSMPDSFPEPLSLPETDCFPSPPHSPPPPSSKSTTHSLSRAFSSLGSLLGTTPDRTLPRPACPKPSYSDLTRTAYPSQPLPNPTSSPQFSSCPSQHFSHTINKICTSSTQQPNIPTSLPTVYLVQYGLNWHQDVILLPHNAIRAELVDLVAMLSFCLDQKSNLLLDDMRLLSMWWPTFSSFLQSYLLFEDSQLLPWVYAGRRERELQTFQKNLLAHRNTVQHHTTEVANIFSLFRCRPSEDVVPLLFRVTADFIPTLLTYLEMEERFLPIFIARFHSETDVAAIERKLVKALDVRLLTRWIPSRKVRRAMRRTYMTPAARMSYYRRCRRAIVSHLGIVQLVTEERGER